MILEIVGPGAAGCLRFAPRGCFCTLLAPSHPAVRGHILLPIRVSDLALLRGRILHVPAGLLIVGRRGPAAGGRLLGWLGRARFLAFSYGSRLGLWWGYLRRR